MINLGDAMISDENIAAGNHAARWINGQDCGVAEHYRTVVRKKWHTASVVLSRGGVLYVDSKAGEWTQFVISIPKVRPITA